MKIIELDLAHDNFFCPVTGTQILYPEDELAPSKALMFCYVDLEGGIFEHIHENIKPILSASGMDLNADILYMDYKEFNVFLIEKFKAYDNYITFALGHPRYTAYFCIDMNYNIDYPEY